MKEYGGFRKFIIVSVLCICPALAVAGAEDSDGSAYDRAITIWIVIFNDPSACMSTPCSEAEFGREGNPARIDVCNVSGATAATFGWTGLGGHFAEGSNFGCIFSGLGLEDADVAEIHFVIQKHGRARADVLMDQLTEFLGGCPPNMCLDIHFAIHLASGEFETVSNVYRFKDASLVWGATSTLRRMMGGIKVTIYTWLHEGKDWYGMAGAD